METGEYQAKDELNTNSLKCTVSFETTSPQIYCYCYFYKLFGSLGSQLTRFFLFPQVFCSFFQHFPLQIHTRVSEITLIMKLQFKFLFPSFFLFTSPESSTGYAHDSRQLFFFFQLCFKSEMQRLYQMIKNISQNVCSLTIWLHNN